MLNLRHQTAYARLAVSLLLAFAPAFMAEAQTLQYTYQYYAPPTSPPIPTRSPTRSANSGHFVDMATLPDCMQFRNTTPAPQTIGSAAVQISPPEQCPGHANRATYQLGYLNISGGQTGPITLFADANGLLQQFNPTVTFAAGSKVVAQAVYFVVGGGAPSVCRPNCSSAGYIDEYDDTTGQLADDPFVSVDAPPGTPDATRTKTGNLNGYVDTTAAKVAVAANATTPAGAFVDWVVEPSGAAGIAAGTLTFNAGADGSGLAHYASCPAGYAYAFSATLLTGQCGAIPPPPPCQQAMNYLRQIVTDLGPLIPVAQYAALEAQLHACVLEHQLSATAVADLEAQYACIALRREGKACPQKPVM